MAIHSDLSPLVEYLKIISSYFIGTLSLLVNAVTLTIIIRNGSFLDHEIKVLSIFLQVTCLVENFVITILVIPFFYPSAGGGYCMGILSGLFSYQLLSMISMFLMVLMLSAFGMLIIARHQLLLLEGSLISLGRSTRKLACWLTMQTEKEKQNEVLDTMYPQLKWRERGLNWYIFDGRKSASIVHVWNTVCIANFLLGIFLVVVPFIHMLVIVLRAGRRVHSHSSKRDGKHLEHARTVMIQFLVLVLFLLVPIVLATIVARFNNIHAHAHTLMALALRLFFARQFLRGNLPKSSLRRGNQVILSQCSEERKSNINSESRRFSERLRTMCIDRGWHEFHEKCILNIYHKISHE